MRVRRVGAAAIALSADPAGAANNAVDLRITRFFVIASRARTSSVTIGRNPIVIAMDPKFRFGARQPGLGPPK